MVKRLSPAAVTASIQITPRYLVSTLVWCAFVFAPIVANSAETRPVVTSSAQPESHSESQPESQPESQSAPVAKQAHQRDTIRESLKKIVASPNRKNETVIDGQDPALGPVIVAPKITTEPAPGARELASEPQKAVVKPQPIRPTVAADPVKKSAPLAGQPVSAETSLRWLTNGNSRYVKKGFRADGKAQSDRERTAIAQKPHAIVLACSDSRVAPEIVFDQAIGEIVTIRVAGETLDNAVIATIESTLEKLQPQLLIVMGHTRCETVEAALSSKETSSSASIEKILADIRPRLKTVISEKRSPNLEVEATLNADGVARELLKRSELIRAKVESGELTIKPALYRVENGNVKFY